MNILFIYQTDTECLKMDIQEEGNQKADTIEENRQMKIIEINSESTSFAKFSATERQELAEKLVDSFIYF